MWDLCVSGQNSPGNVGETKGGSVMTIRAALTSVCGDGKGQAHR